jgi:hypothetical protein
MLLLIGWRLGFRAAGVLLKSAGAALLGLVLLIAGPAVGFALIASCGRTALVVGAAGGAMWGLAGGYALHRAKPGWTLLTRAYRELAEAPDTGLVAVTFSLRPEDGGRAKRALWAAGIWRLAFQPEVRNPEPPELGAQISVWRQKTTQPMRVGVSASHALRVEVEALLSSRGIDFDYVRSADPAG